MQNHFITNLHVQQGQVVQDIDFWNSIVQSLPVSTIKIPVMQISICKSSNKQFRACFWNLFRQASTPLSRIQPSTLKLLPRIIRDSMAIVAVELGFLLSFSSDFVSLQSYTTSIQWMYHPLASFNLAMRAPENLPSNTRFMHVNREYTSWNWETCLLKFLTR